MHPLRSGIIGKVINKKEKKKIGLFKKQNKNKNKQTNKQNKTKQ